MNKGQFSTSQEYEASLRNRQYRDREPIDTKRASMCLRDEVVQLGDRSNTVGACLLAPECDYRNDKSSGVVGFCLKQSVGVEIK